MESPLADTVLNLVGIGLYTPAEAGRLIAVNPVKLTRWLRGHKIGSQYYEPLWTPEVDIGDERVYLSFRDMMEARVASALIERGISSQKVRRAISLAREMVGERPLSTTWLRTDGRSVFLQIAHEDGEEPSLIDLLKSQYAFRAIVEVSLRDVEFDGAVPSMWWPRGKRAGIVIDPARAFGRPIEEETSVPIEVLVSAVQAEGSVDAAARAWQVPPRAIRRAITFQEDVTHRRAA